MARNRKPKESVQIPIKDRKLTDCVDESLVDENVLSFRAIQDKLVNIYAKKNHDYGDSFNQGCNELGVGYAFSRIFDKTKRFQTLAKGIMTNSLSIEVQDETVEDTIMDLANYCVMYLAWRDKHIHVGEAEAKHFSIIEGRDNQVDIKHPSTGELESNNNTNTYYHKLHDELFTNKVILLQVDSRKDCTNRVTSKYGFDLFRDENDYVYIKSVTGELIDVTIDGEYVICIIQ
jgi:hypothetical protein